MLVQSSIPGSIEAALSFVPDDVKGDWTPGAEAWEKSPKFEKNPLDGCEVVPIMVRKRSTGDSCSLNFASSSSQISTVSTMSESSIPAFVYQRRKLRRDSVTVFPAQASTKPSDGCLSAMSCGAPSLAAKEGNFISLVDLESEVVGTTLMPPVECSGEALVSKSGCVTGSLVKEEPCSKGAPKGDTHRAADYCSVNDSYSSSKSNVELGSASLRPEVDDTGECSSSSALVVEGSHDDLSERDMCISILRSQGLLQGDFGSRICTSAEGPVTSGDSNHMRTCKVCDHSETIQRMLICDQCEAAFHVSCCNPRLKKIPVDEWFCHSCLRKKRKLLKETTGSENLNLSSEMSEEGPIASMLRDTEPYVSRVRIGQDFQADVPDWFGPSVDEVDGTGEPLEIHPSECGTTHGWIANKPSRLSSIGNWLQCQEVIEGIGERVDGTVCGKWRRAPLFEVQSDNWECYRAVLWDPAHADCAVPQELDTDQVLKQLKYIEMLRPRLAAKRRKLDPARSIGSQDRTEDVRNTQTP